MGVTAGRKAVTVIDNSAIGHSHERRPARDEDAWGVDGLHPVGRCKAHGEEEGDERRESEVLTSVEVWGGDCGGLDAKVAVEDSLDHPEHIGGGEDDSGGGEDCPAGVVRDSRLHGAGEGEELADEAVEHGKADDGEGSDDEEGDHPGELRGEAAELADVVGGVALVEEAEE